MTALKYKRGTFNLGAIEDDVQHLRDSRYPLTFESLRYFVRPEHWWFENFWVFPPKEHLQTALERRSFDFWNLPKREEDVISDLFTVFRSIEHVSIILRFVRPDHYGILSAPVERMLEVRRSGKAIETYRRYLDDLRAIRDKPTYGLTRAADVDMALWVLHERCFGTHLNSELRQEFEADTFMLELRARNLVQPLRDLPLGRLALGFREVRPDLAALIACHQLEIRIREACERFGVVLGDGSSDNTLKSAIDALARAWPHAAHRSPYWHRLREKRNGLVHREQHFSRRELDDLLEELLVLEAESAAGAGARRRR